MSDQKDEIGSLKRELQKFQSDRIRQTYSDIAKMKQYFKITDFFINEIYASKDFDFRNQSIKDIYRRSRHFLTEEMDSAITKVIELNDLSDDLDVKMVSVMQQHGIQKIDNIDVYAFVYSRCGERENRKRQIDLLVFGTRGIHQLSKKAFIGLSLTALHRATKLLGIAKIMDFLYDGYEAFHRVDDIGYFTDKVYERETLLSKQLFEKREG